MNSFQENLSNIQKAASELVNLQQNIKLSGKLTAVDQQLYAENLEKLGVSAQNLAHIQQMGGQDDFRLLFEGTGNRIQEPQIEEADALNIVEKEPGKEEENVGEEGDDNDDSSDNNKPNTEDSVQVNIPEDDASIAEAKPIGLAIAGEGGVASSKPIATAVVGPGGLAIAKPIATAIAGITPSEVSGLGIPLGGTTITHKIKAHTRINIPNSNKYGLTMGSGYGILVGPNYFEESRMNQRPINTSEDSKLNEKKNSEEMQETTEDQNTEKQPIFAEPEIMPPMSPPNQFNHQQQNPHAAETILPSQYPFIPPMLPFRFNWETEPIESSAGYEPIPFLDNRAFNGPQYFPYPQHMPINPYQFYHHFQ